MNKAKYYIKSLRLRTLPLSLSGILMGGLLAMASGTFRLPVFISAIVTTLSLQILSNVSNEYGDAVNGADNDGRLGPIRGVQSGALKLKDIKRMIYIFIVLSAVSGVLLIISSFQTLFCIESIAMLALGLLAMVAAIKYTVGKNNYGYKGWGDVAVFLFFGWVGTMGAYFLITHTIEWKILLPASAVGLLSVGVLNVNNIRDRENDVTSGKHTLAVRMGDKSAKHYHCILIGGAWGMLISYSLLHYQGLSSWLYLLALPMFAMHISGVLRLSGKQLDAQLRNLSLSTLLLTVLFGVTQLI